MKYLEIIIVVILIVLTAVAGTLEYLSKNNDDKYNDCVNNASELINDFEEYSGISTYQLVRSNSYALDGIKNILLCDLENNSNKDCSDEWRPEPVNSKEISSEEFKDIAYDNKHNFTWRMEDCQEIRWSNDRRGLILFSLIGVLLLNMIKDVYFIFKKEKKQS